MDNIIYRLREFNTLYAVLCLLVFSMAVVTNHDVFFNVDIIWLLQMAFILLYLGSIRKSMFNDTLQSILAHRLTSVLVAAWLISLTASFVFSPYDVSNYPLIEIRIMSRYIHTLTYLLFFFCVRDFLSRNQFSPLPLIFTIVGSVVFVALSFFVVLLVTDTRPTELTDLWRNDPLFAANIRHTGYQVTTACAALLIYLTKKEPNLNYFAISLVLWTFLFWLGGRGSTLSLLLTSVVIGAIAIVKRQAFTKYLATIAGLSLLSLLFSEMLSVFSWNGLFHAATKFTYSSINAVSASRIEIWLSTITYIKQYPLLGMGPEGYFYMPNRVVGIHPHNMFLQFLIEWGFPGAILFITLMTRAFWHGIKLHLIKAKDLSFAAISAGAVIVALGLHGLTDGTFYHPQPSVYLAIVFAIWTLPLKTDTG